MSHILWKIWNKCARAARGGGWRLDREVRNRRTPRGLIWTIYCSFFVAIWRCKRTLTESAGGKFRCSVGEAEAGIGSSSAKKKKCVWKLQSIPRETSSFTRSHHVGALVISSIWEASSYTLRPTWAISISRGGVPPAFSSGGITPQAGGGLPPPPPPRCHWYAVIITSSRHPGLLRPLLLPLSR